MTRAAVSVGRLPGSPTSTSPEVGRINPAAAFNEVVFPEPLGPSRATVSPADTCSVSASTARCPPNRLVKDR